MNAYLDLLRRVRQGVRCQDRTGTGALRLFGRQLRFDLNEGFPLLTTKKLHFRSIAHELLWFLQGGTNTDYLHRNGVRIWDEWADERGELGPIYGAQWRAWRCADGRTVDQLTQTVQRIRNDPASRRLLVSAWNVGELEAMALPPCHLLFQFAVLDGRLSCQMYQRSADVFLGLPFNIASYALLTAMTAQATGLAPGELICSLGDVHLYLNHLQQADEQLRRKPYPLPRLRLNPEVRDLLAFRYEDIELHGYRAHPHLPAPVAV